MNNKGSITFCNMYNKGTPEKEINELIGQVSWHHSLAI